MASVLEIGVSLETLPESITPSQKQYTLYTPTGSRSWSGDLDLIEEDKRALGCKTCDEVSAESKLIFIGNRAKPEKIIFTRQEEAQAAGKTS